MMDRRKKKILLGAATLAMAAGVGGGVLPARAVTAQVSASITIIKNVAISATQSLDFGVLNATASGTIKVSNTGSVSTTGGVSSSGGSPQAGGFKILATVSRAISVTAPASVTLTETAVGVATMTVSKFTVDAVGPINTTPFTTSLTATSQTGFRLGGTLNVGAGQTQGTYSGSVTLTAAYQ